MKKAVIYVFTGTGNTRFAADQIAAALEKYGIETTVWEARVPFTDTPKPEDFDIAGFGYPIYAFNTPSIFLRFVRTLPDGNGMPAFIFKTSGEPSAANNASSLSLIRLLQKKGYAPTMDRHLLMPYNILFRYPDALAKQMALHTRAMAKIAADEILNADKSGAADGKFRYGLWPLFCMAALRIQWFGAPVNGVLFHVRKDLCTGCGLCARTCPAANIRMEGGVPHFSTYCAMCMSCTLRCPKDAVRPGLLTPLRINGMYPLKKLMEDRGLPETYVNEDTKGYFRLIRPYYRRTNEEIRAWEERTAGERGSRKYP